jgi:hypothetical protein
VLRILDERKASTLIELFKSIGDLGKWPKNRLCRVENVDRDLLTVRVEIKNEGPDPIYIETKPVREDGSDGPYVTVDPLGPSRLVVAIRFYPLPKFGVFNYEAGVHLEWLAPGKTNSEILVIKLPLRSTEPPFSDRQSNLETIKSIRSRRTALRLLAATGICGGITPLASFAGGQCSSHSDHAAWVVESLERMQTIKLGMTRKQLLTVFTTEGGISTAR